MDRRIIHWSAGRALLASLTASFAMLCGFASSASALMFGVQFQGDFNQVQSEMLEVGKSGSQLYRLPFIPPSFNGDWTLYDTIVERAAVNGVTVMPVLGGRFNGQPGVPDATEKAKFSEVLGQAVCRYGYGGKFWTEKFAKSHPGVTARPWVAWETWNEPNLEGISPTAFGEYSGWAGAAIQTYSNLCGSRGTEVVMGAVFSQGTEDTYQQAKTYVENAYLAPGAGNGITGIGIHPYAIHPDTFTNYNRIQAVKEQISGFRTRINVLPGGPTKSLWVTEIGWPAVGGDNPVGEAEQANLLRQSFQYAKANAAGLNLQAMLWYNFRDAPLSNWAAHCGLRAADGSYRLAWYAFQEETGAPRWPIPTWHYDNLLGQTESDPEVSSWGENRLDVFIRGVDNALWHRWWSPAGWSAWESMGGKLESGPSAVSWGHNRIDVVARLAEGKIGHWYWDGGGWKFDYMGGLTGNFAGDLAISSWGPGRLDVFARGATSNKLWHAYYDSVAWKGWEDMGGTLTSSPGAVSWGLNRIDVVARDPENKVAHWYWDNTGVWKKDNLGGTISSDPELSSWGPNRLDVFARGAGGSLWHKYYETNWSAWANMGGSITGGPGAVSWGLGRIDVVAQRESTVESEDKTVDHWYWAL